MYNKIILIGNLTRDVELKYLPSGSAIANCAIATSHKYKMQDGSQKEEVCFIDFTIFGKSGEIFNQYARKGSKVMLEGRLDFQQWKAQDGTNRSRHILKVDTFKFLDGKDSTQQQGGYNPNQPAPGYNNQSSAPNYEQGSNQQDSYSQNIPTIDIDNDEIPHSRQ